jgi:hypothetical protein
MQLKEGIMFRTLLSGSVAVLLSAGMAAGTAEAGFLRVTGADGNTNVSVQLYDKDENTIGQILVKKSNNQGVAEFGLGDIEAEKKIATAFISKTAQGKRENGAIKITPGTVNIASLEPFQVPSFTTSVAALAVIDLVPFLAQPDPFSLGQPLTITNGTIPESAAVTFLDASSVTSIDQLTPSFVATLPPLPEGAATVLSFDAFSPVPEPGSLILLGVGVVGMLGLARRFGGPAVTSH